MRKTLLLAIVVLSALLMVWGVPTLTVPKGSIPVTKMLEGLNGRQLNILEVVEYRENWIAVEVNGFPMTFLTPDSKEMENTIYWLTPNHDNGAPGFGRMNLFDTELWDLERERNPEMRFYIFRNDFTGNDDRTAEDLVLAHIEDVNWVSAAKWEGTQATVVTWEYPINSPLIVHNMDTKEDAFMAVGFAQDSKGNNFEIGRGQVVWGYLYFMPDQAIDWGGIKVRETPR